MKVINLNESQYQRLFELSQTATALGDDNPSGVPPLSLDQTWITADILKKNGEVSVKDNYVVFCLDSNVDTPYDWFLSANNDDSSCLKFLGSTSCSEVLIKNLDDRQMHTIFLYQAKKDGRAKISYDFAADYGTYYRTDDVQRSITADCIILDDAKTVLLPEMIRITIKDELSGMLIRDSVPKINPSIFHPQTFLFS